MTTLPCPACGRPTGGLHFCESCGVRLSDNTTRYLCAAVHLDATYCDAALDEFLVEGVRAVPPSPGGDSASVLRDAVAARNRRRLRDGLLAVLLVISLFTNVGLFVLWTVAAVVARGALGLRGSDRSVGRTAAAILGLVLVGLLVFGVGGALVGGLLYSSGLGTLDSQLTGNGSLLGVGLLGFLMLGVLVADAGIVHWLVLNCFRRGQFLADPRGVRGRWEVLFRTFGAAARGPELDRIADADRAAATEGAAAVVVHRGFSPFVGAGLRTSQGALAMSLEPSREEGGPEPTPIDVVGLHDQISRAMAGLRASTSLGPGGRLADLEILEQVLASSDELIAHLTTYPGYRVLPDRMRPPLQTMPTIEAQALAETPAEWARYYRCYRIEAWERDLTPSTYIHIGTDQRTLYFERVHCVLMPVDERFREIDGFISDVRPLAQGLVELLLLPATILGRLRAFIGAQPITERPGEIVPDRYGALHSLRELASDPDQYRNYFQMADVGRYQRIVDRVLLRSVGAYLEAHGFSAIDFQEQFRGTVNDFRGASFANSAVGPDARTTNSGPPPAAGGNRPAAASKG